MFTAMRGLPKCLAMPSWTWERSPPEPSHLQPAALKYPGPSSQVVGTGSAAPETVVPGQTFALIISTQLGQPRLHKDDGISQFLAILDG